MFSMNGLENLHRQLQEAVDDGDYISPEKAAVLLRTLEDAMRFGEQIGRQDEPLHPSEEAAYEAFTLCDASSQFAPPALIAAMKHLDADDAARFSESVRTVSDVMDRMKFGSGSGVAPDMFLVLPANGGTIVYWIRFRQVERILEAEYHKRRD